MVIRQDRFEEMADLDIDISSFTAKKLLLRPTKSQPAQDAHADSGSSPLEGRPYYDMHHSSTKTVFLPPLVQKSYGGPTLLTHSHPGHHDKCSCGLPNPKFCMLDLIASVHKYKDGNKQKEFAWVPMGICQ